ncbi:FadR/GntR family transcriptional regulator [Paenibacillus sp. J2TS4]|uniref:FadR/GntR family transcriptional regulator n=1 Tax=Paenibacillus sp. J2TS4 TaxID=2807194 RepID=UPI001B1BE472|nr:FadR/GntR family transcriptional regulator [Paenibacillus sp. J2TS4]GIP35258.1 GntR family transcriptional regulator [Paenibacillus sp. J2TS4]
MEISKISNRKIYEEIADQIKKQIVGGGLPPGTKLPSTRELSESYQVGRSTVREALSALKAMGLVEIRQGEGSYVRCFDPEDLAMPGLESILMSRTTVLELLEARQSLEISNAGLAATKRTEEDLRTFEFILSTMEENIGNEEEGEKYDLLFHMALARATHNSIMVRLLETISSQVELAIRETRRLQLYSKTSASKRLWMEHKEIYEAVQAADANLAQDKMRTHLYHVEQVLIRHLPS